MRRTLRLILWPVCLLLGGSAFAGPQNITLPIGTEIAVRTIDRIDSKKADQRKSTLPLWTIRLWSTA